MFKKLLMQLFILTIVMPQAFAYAPHYQMMLKDHIRIDRGAVRTISLKNLSHYIDDHVLDLSRSDLKDGDLMPVIAFLKNHPEITGINLQWNNDLTPKSLKLLNDVPSLTEMNLSRSYKKCSTKTHICEGTLEPADMQVFAANSHLKKLDISFQNIRDDGAIALSKSKSLEWLDVQVNQLGTEGAAALLRNQSLKSLYIGYSEGLYQSMLADLIEQNNTLKVLLLGGDIGDSDGVKIANNKSLTELYISAWQMGDEGMIALLNNPRLLALAPYGGPLTDKVLDAIATNKTLKFIELVSDFFEKPKWGDEVAFKIAKNTTLQAVALIHTGITPKGIAAVAQIPTLHELYLTYSHFIADQGVAEIAKYAPQLEVLDVQDCHVTEKGVASIALLKNLTTLNLMADQVGDVGAALIIKYLALQNLDVGYTKIHDAGMLAIATTRTIEDLFARGNSFGLAAEMALRKNHVIKKLDI